MLVEWWNKEKTDLRYVKYTVSGTAFYVGARPDTYNATKDFCSDMLWLNVSEEYLLYPSEHAWLPINEGKGMTVETVFGCLHTLHNWFSRSKKIYIHCMGGTHRSPSIFGLFLLSFQNKKFIESKEVVGYTHPSDPLEYAATYMEREPEIAYLIKNFNPIKSLNIESILREKSYGTF